MVDDAAAALPSRSSHFLPLGGAQRQRQPGHFVCTSPGQRHSRTAVAVVVHQPPVLGFDAGTTVARWAEADQLAEHPRPAQPWHKPCAPLDDGACG